MSTDIAPLAGVRPNDKAIAKYLGLNYEDPRTHAVLAVCQRYDLDPILKHVIVIPKGGAYITRDGLLHVAHRSGQLDGIVLEEQGIDIDAAEHWAIVAVYRKDMSHPFRYRGRYPLAGSNKAYGPEMAIKCAEAMSLRRAFDVTALPVLEEHHTDFAPEPRTVDTGRLHVRRTPKQPEPEQPAAEPAPYEPGTDYDADIDEAEILEESVDA
jgi:hypothetical protein